MDNGFSGQEGQKVPEMTPEKVDEISGRYIELFENITGKKFEKAEYGPQTYERIETNIENMIARII
jgi:phosphoribosylaminoimidazole-succinocarboxamide synthase